MYHGWILNGIKFGLNAASYFPNGISEDDAKALANWLSLHPNEGTFAQWREEQRNEREPEA